MSDVSKAKNDLAVLTKSIAIKEAQFLQLRDDIKAAQAIADSRKSKAKRELEKLKDELSLLSSEENKAKIKIRGLFEEINILKETLQDTKKQELERNLYLREQEKLISDVIENGNTTIKSIKYEIEGIEKQKFEINSDLYELNKDKSALIDELSYLTERKAKMPELYAKEATVLENRLSKIRQEIATAQDKLKSVHEEVEAKLIMLKDKEEGLLTKYDTLRKGQTKLATEKRHFEGTRSLYDL